MCATRPALCYFFVLFVVAAGGDPVCNGTQICGVYEPHCCWEPELGCNGTVSDSSIDCADQVPNVQLRRQGPMQFVVSWGLPSTVADESRTIKYNLLVYDTSDRFDNVPPYSTLQKRSPLGRYDERFNRNVAPCRVWFSDVDHTALYESGQVTSFTLIDSGFGVAPGGLSISSVNGSGFSATYSVCPLPTTRRSVDSSRTGLSAGLCNFTVTNAGEYYLEDGLVDFDSAATAAATSPPQIAFHLTKELSSSACTSLLCRPAFIFTNDSAAGFQTSSGQAFPGIKKGHEYAFAVIRQRNDGFGRFPQFDADLLGTNSTGEWVKIRALDLSSAPQGLSTSSCSPNKLKVTWMLPHDLGALSREERIASGLLPVSPLAAIGGLAGIVKFHAQISTTSDFATSINHTVSEFDARSGNGYEVELTNVLGDGVTVYIRVGVETEVGLGEWATSSLTSYPEVYLPSPPVLEVPHVTVEGGGTIALTWHVPFNTGRRNVSEQNNLEPIDGYQIRLQGMVLYDGHPSRSFTCGVSEPANPMGVCCLRWRDAEAVCGGVHELCDRLYLPLRGTLRGVPVKLGGAYTISLAARNAAGMSPPTTLEVVAGTGRDLWGRPAAHCTTSTLPECAVNASGSFCAGSNLSAAWCNARPGEEPGFGAAEAEDEDECAEDTHNCDVDAVCANTDGSFTCACKAGFYDDGVYGCADSDECAAGSHACVVGAGAECLNTEGSYVCVCPAGFFGTNASELCSPCPANSTSGANSSTVEACACDAGYTSASGYGPCADLDECVSGNSTCAEAGSGGVCENTVGSFTCSCAPNFFGTGHACSPCPSNSSAPAGSTQEDDCTCDAGLGRVFSPCYGTLCLQPA